MTATACLRLPDHLDLKTAASIKTDIAAHRGEALELDGSDVRWIGGLGLQVLLAASAAWRADGLSFCLTRVSEPLQEGLRRLGAASALDITEESAT